MLFYNCWVLYSFMGISGNPISALRITYILMQGRHPDVCSVARI